MKFSYKIWDKKEFIGNGSPEYVINEYKVGKEDNIILLLDYINNPCEIHKESDVRLKYHLGEDLSIEEVGEKFVEIRTEETNRSLDDAYNKISTLEAENSKLLLDSAIKANEINTLNRNTANLTLEIAKMKGSVK